MASFFPEYLERPSKYFPWHNQIVRAPVGVWYPDSLRNDSRFRWQMNEWLNKLVCVQMSAWHCPHLLLSAVLRRRCCWAQGSNRSISPVRRALSSKPAAAACGGRRVGQTDRRTTDRCTDPARRTMRAVSINKWTSYRPGGGRTIRPRRWQFDSRRINVRPRMGPQSAHLWWPAVAKLLAASVPIA